MEGKGGLRRSTKLYKGQDQDHGAKLYTDMRVLTHIPMGVKQGRHLPTKKLDEHTIRASAESSSECHCNALLQY